MDDNYQGSLSRDSIEDAAAGEVPCDATAPSGKGGATS